MKRLLRAGMASAREEQAMLRGVHKDLIVFGSLRRRCAQRSAHTGVHSCSRAPLCQSPRCRRSGRGPLASDSPAPPSHTRSCLSLPDTPHLVVGPTTLPPPPTARLTSWPSHCVALASAMVPKTETKDSASRPWAMCCVAERSMCSCLSLTLSSPLWCRRRLRKMHEAFVRNRATSSSLVRPLNTDPRLLSLGLFALRKRPGPPPEAQVSPVSSLSSPEPAANGHTWADVGPGPGADPGPTPGRTPGSIPGRSWADAGMHPGVRCLSARGRAPPTAEKPCGAEDRDRDRDARGGGGHDRERERSRSRRGGGGDVRGLAV